MMIQIWKKCVWFLIILMLGYSSYSIIGKNFDILASISKTSRFFISVGLEDSCSLYSNYKSLQASINNKKNNVIYKLMTISVYF